MKRHMLLAAFALATIALFGFAGSAPAEEG
jgi:hypothetical protein